MWTGGGAGGVTAGWKIIGAKKYPEWHESVSGHDWHHHTHCPAELHAVSPELQAARDGAEPAVGPHEPQADPNLPAVQQNQRETRPGSGQ